MARDPMLVELEATSPTKLFAEAQRMARQIIDEEPKIVQQDRRLSTMARAILLSRPRPSS